MILVKIHLMKEVNVTKSNIKYSFDQKENNLVIKTQCHFQHYYSFCYLENTLYSLTNSGIFHKKSTKANESISSRHLTS